MSNQRLYLPHITNRTDIYTPFQTFTEICFVLQRGEIEFEVVYVAPEVDSDDENVEYEDDSGHRYRLYLDELEEVSGASHSNGTADPASLQGKRTESIHFLPIKEQFLQHLFICVYL